MLQREQRLHALHCSTAGGGAASRPCLCGSVRTFPPVVPGVSQWFLCVASHPKGEGSTQDSQMLMVERNDKCQKVSKSLQSFISKLLLAQDEVPSVPLKLLSSSVSLCSFDR